MRACFIIRPLMFYVSEGTLFLLWSWGMNVEDVNLNLRDELASVGFVNALPQFPPTQKVEHRYVSRMFWTEIKFISEVSGIELDTWKRILQGHGRISLNKGALHRKD